MMNAPLPDFHGEHRTEPVPPEPYRLMANIDATLNQNIFHLPKRPPITNVHQYREANYLGRTVEITEGIARRRRLRNLAKRLKPIYSDNASGTHAVNS